MSIYMSMTLKATNYANTLWKVLAICFIIAGIEGENTVFVILGCVYIFIGPSIRKKTKDKDEVEK